MINEVQYDPKCANDSANEWIELYNFRNEPLVLIGWTISDNNNSDHLPPLSIAPGGFAIIAATANFSDNFPDCDCEVVFVGTIGNGLSNGGDSIILTDSSSATIDAISYGSDKTYMSLPDVAEKHSLERSPAGGDFIDNPNPSPCRGLLPPTPTVSATPSPTPSATPTEPPTVASDGDILINEVLFDPLPPCKETDCEWIELYNPGSESITLIGWNISDNSKSDRIPPLSIDPGGFAIIAATANFSDNFPGCNCTIVFIEDGKIGNGLSNTGDCVILSDSAGNVIDGFSYGNDDATDLPNYKKVAEGHSLERSPAGCDFIDNPNPSPCRGLLPPTPTVSPTPSPTPSATPTEPPAAADQPRGSSPPGPEVAGATGKSQEPQRDMWPAIAAAEVLALLGIVYLFAQRLKMKSR